MFYALFISIRWCSPRGVNPSIGILIPGRMKHKKWNPHPNDHLLVYVDHLTLCLTFLPEISQPILSISPLAWISRSWFKGNLIPAQERMDFSRQISGITPMVFFHGFSLNIRLNPSGRIEPPPKSSLSSFPLALRQMSTTAWWNRHRILRMSGANSGAALKRDPSSLGQGLTLSIRFNTQTHTQYNIYIYTLK